jgi:hypothetical protein
MNFKAWMQVIATYMQMEVKVKDHVEVDFYSKIKTCSHKIVGAILVG